MEGPMQHVVAFVTGGASGIGKAVVERIVKHGGKAVIVDKAPEGQKVAEEIGSSTIFCKVDVTSESDVNEALARAKEQFGFINAVINCAGITALQMPYEFDTEKAHPLEIYRKLMDVNALGTFNVTRLAVGMMAANVPDENQQRGVIINISSIWARDCPAYGVAYAASKAAIKGMTIPFARCFAEKGIRVVTITPGFTDTPMTNVVRLIPKFNKEGNESVLTPKRAAYPDEIAHMAQTIIENPYINAVDMEVSAGWHTTKKIQDKSIYSSL